MTKYQSLPAHNAACNEIYYKLQDCRKEHPIGWFAGVCSDINLELQRCLKNQHKARQEASYKRYQERQARLRKAKQKEAEDKE